MSRSSVGQFARQSFRELAPTPLPGPPSPIAGRETLLAPPGFEQGGYAVAFHGNEIVAFIAGGPVGEPTDIHTVTFDANESAGTPQPLHVRRPDAASQEASIGLPGAAYAGTDGIAFWQETLTYPFGSQTSTLGRRIDAQPDDTRIVLAGPGPVGTCRRGFYGELAVATSTVGDIVGLWRTGSACVLSGDLRLFGFDSGALDIATLAFGPFDSAAAAPGVGALIEGLSDGALATGDASTLGVWWQRRYETAGPVDSIEATILGGAAGSRRRLSEARSGSSYDPGCNGPLSCLRLAESIAAPAATSHGGGFLVAWVADPDQSAPPEDPRRTTELRARLVDANGAPDDRSEAIVADDDVVKSQPLAASDGTHTLLVWLEPEGGSGGSTVLGIAFTSGDQPARAEAVALAEGVRSAALTAVGGRFVLVVERVSVEGAALYAIPIAIDESAASGS